MARRRSGRIADPDPIGTAFRQMREGIDRFVEESAAQFCAEMERERPGGEEWDDHRRRVMADFVEWQKRQGVITATPKDD